MPTHELEFVFAKPIHFPKETEEWLLGIKRKIGGRILGRLTENTDGLDRYIECVALDSVPGAYLFCSFYQRDINDALTRAGIFMGAGKGIPSEMILAHDDPTLLNYKKLVAGHNLPGSVVKRFFAALAGARDSKLETNRSEKIFRDLFLNSPEITERQENFYVIGLSIQTTKSYESILSHEILHAQYFLNPAFRKAVREFWQDIPTEERAGIRETIGKAYNIVDDGLVMDEFQAYLLQAKADRDLLRGFIRYREPLFSKLRESAVSPILYP
jgi:hypothetical protein